MITQQLQNLYGVIEDTSDRKSLSISALKQILLSYMTGQPKIERVDPVVIGRILNQYCTKVAVLSLYSYAVQEVDAYSRQRHIGGEPIRNLQAVSDKLQQAVNRCWLIEIALEKICHDIFSKCTDDDFLTIEKHLLRLSDVFKSEFIPGFDDILFIMGAKGYMISHAVANIWEEINAWHHTAETHL
jgi:hypothetical protein